MCQIHEPSNFLIVAFVESVAYTEHSVFLTEDECRTLNILSRYISADLFKVIPCSISQGLSVTLRMFLVDSFHNVLA